MVWKVQCQIIVTNVRSTQNGWNVLKPKVIQSFHFKTIGILKNSGFPKGGNSYLRTRYSRYRCINLYGNGVSVIGKRYFTKGKQSSKVNTKSADLYNT